MAGEWSNRGPEILGSSLSICILSVIILVWRIAYGIKSKRKLMVCDYLLIVAAMLNIVTSGVRIKYVYHGMGRHILDPSISQVINLIAVTLLKWSICAYLLALPFGLIYKIVVWVSVAMVLVFNLTMPMLGLFGCRPFEANWNKGMKGKCFYKGGQAITYLQGITNILTDIVYVVAPIIYLSTVQLSSRTQWGLRFVFCLGLIATVCSIFKTVELRNLHKTRDPTWDGVNLSIWSATELSVGILVASLPPLRREFEKFLRKVLPSSFQTSNKRTPSNGIPMYNVSRISKKNTRATGRSDLGLDDGDSERSILPEGAESGITKTIVHEITTQSRTDSERGKELDGPNRIAKS